MAIPTCPTDCGASLAVVQFDYCNPKVLLSEITRIFVAKNTSTPFTDWTQPAEWATRLSSTSVAGDDYIRPLTVIGDKPAPSLVEKDISNGRKLVIRKDHLLNFLIDDATPENHEFMRQLECGGVFRMWYETAGGLLFGGNEGIQVNLTLDMVLNRGVEEHMTYQGTAKWKSKFTEERTVSPITPNGGTATPFAPDTTLTFEAATDDADAPSGVGGTVPAIDPDLKFEYNAITPQTGLPSTMTIRVGGVEAIVIDFPSDYIGQRFRFTDAAAVVHEGLFTDGTVNF